MSDEGFQIEVGQAVRRHIIRRSSPLKDRGRAVLPYDSPRADPIPVFVSEEAMRAMERQAAADKEREIGGVLLGGFYRNDEGSFVEVTDLIEAESAKGTDVSLTFTHQTWKHIHEQVAAREDEAQIVGWYHSHPGLGVFMSKQDEFIHSSFFADPWHVAIVHDPIYTNWGCFKWADDKLDRAGGFYVFAVKREAKRLRDYIKGQLANRQASPRSASPATDRLAGGQSARQYLIWIAIAALLVAQIVALRIALPRRGAPPKVDEYATATRLLRISDLSGAEEHLKRELTLHPDNAQAYNDLRALAKALVRPGVANPGYDRQNLILSSGDRLAQTAGSEARPTGSIEVQMPVVPKAESVGADYAGGDPKEGVLDEYEAAAATRSARIARAKAVNAAARTRWSREAVRWLAEEELRQIAYGKMVRTEKYGPRYSSLSTAKKKAVDRIFAGIK